MDEGPAAQQAVGTVASKARWLTDVQPPHAAELLDASEMPRYPQERVSPPLLQQAAPPRQIGNEGVNEESFSTQTARPLDKAGDWPKTRLLRSSMCIRRRSVTGRFSKKLGTFFATMATMFVLPYLYAMEPKEMSDFFSHGIEAMRNR